ncbi:MAG TPA: tetratricopeptide repeat protein [Streptosporangiaceae bacterium]|nr:tetratricopeptide repeat protein [Streptosporangiaceae bacterium]
MLSREEFDALEFGAARTGDHRTAAVRMSELADACSQPSELTRGEAYLRAGEQWLLADDPQAAADGFRRALADDGGSLMDARVSLARALFQLGDTGEARELISTLETEGRNDPRLCDLVAELLVEQSDLIGALDWANTGVELCLGVEPGGLMNGQDACAPPSVPPGADKTELRLLLSLRYRIRNDMGLAEDGYDKLLDEL